MMETELVRRAKTFAEDALRKDLPGEYVFHNLKHTRDVAAAATEIGIASGLTDDQLETALIAAWLHDIGYIYGCENHETSSVKAAVKLLTEWQASEKKIEDVQRTIMATKMPQSPKDIIGEVLCDADLYHLSNLHPSEQSQCLRKEFESIKNLKFENDKEWLKFNLSFLKHHTYFTVYGRTVLQPRKKENQKRIKKLIKGDKPDSGSGEKDFKDDKDLRKQVEKLRAKLEKIQDPIVVLKRCSGQHPKIMLPLAGWLTPKPTS